MRPLKKEEIKTDYKTLEQNLKKKIELFKNINPRSCENIIFYLEAVLISNILIIGELKKLNSKFPKK